MSLDFAIHKNNIFFLFRFFLAVSWFPKRKPKWKKGDINKKLVTDKSDTKSNNEMELVHLAADIFVCECDHFRKVGKWIMKRKKRCGFL